MAHNQFRWYEYKGRGISFKTPKASLRIAKSHVFGLKTVSDKHYVTDVENKITIRIDIGDMHRLIENSKGFEGVIGKHNLKPGVGTLDKKDREEGYVRIDSGMFLRGKYDSKKKTLTLEFRNGAVWQYDNVTAKEVMEFEKAKSQGTFYNERFKAVKEGTRMESLSSDFVAESSAESISRYGIFQESDMPVRVCYSSSDLENTSICVGDRVTLRLDGKDTHWCVVREQREKTYGDNARYDVFVPFASDYYTCIYNVPKHALTKIQGDYPSTPDIFKTTEPQVVTASAYSAAHYGIYQTTDIPISTTEDREEGSIYTGDRVTLTLGGTEIHWCVIREWFGTHDSKSYDVFVPIAADFYTLIKRVPASAIKYIPGPYQNLTDIFPSTSQIVTSSATPLFYTEENLPVQSASSLPSRFSVGDRVELVLGDQFCNAVVCGVSFYVSKVAYDLYVYVGKDVETNIYTLMENVDSSFVQQLANEPSQSLSCVASIVDDSVIPAAPTEQAENIAEGERVTLNLNGTEIQSCVVGSVEIGSGEVGSTFGVFVPILPGAYLKVPKVPLKALTRDTYTAVASSGSISKHNLYEDNDLPPKNPGCTDRLEGAKYCNGDRVKVQFPNNRIEGCVVYHAFNSEDGDSDYSVKYSIYVPISPGLYTIIKGIPEFALSDCGCAPDYPQVFDAVRDYVKASVESAEVVAEPSDVKTVPAIIGADSKSASGGMVSESSAYTKSKWRMWQPADLPDAPPYLREDGPYLKSKYNVGARVSLKVLEDGTKIHNCVILESYTGDRGNEYVIAAPWVGSFYVQINNIYEYLLCEPEVQATEPAASNEDAPAEPVPTPTPETATKAEVATATPSVVE